MKAVAEAEADVVAAARAVVEARWARGQAASRILDGGEAAAIHSRAAGELEAAEGRLDTYVRLLGHAMKREQEEIAAHEAAVEQSIADHEEWLDQVEEEAGSNDWWMDVEAARVEREAGLR